MVNFPLRVLPLLLAFQFSVERDPLRIIEIDPHHGHLSGLHSRALPGVSDTVDIYSPLSPELAAHLAALSRFNGRAQNPTRWTVRLFAGPDFLEQMQKERPGAIVALSGRNQENIRYIETALKAGDHLFVDKPWIIDAEAFPRLEAALNLARQKHLITYDWMTLRAEPPYMLVRDLVREESIFGAPVPGSVEKPSVRLGNLHALLKYSNGVPQRRPASFLDAKQQGEGMADVGTHLVDIAQWTLFPGQEIRYRSDVRVLQATHSSIALTLEQFTRLTGESEWPSFLKDHSYYANGSCVYALRGIHVSLESRWEYEAAPGASDSYFTSYLGTRALVELRAGPQERFIPEIYVTPAEGQANYETKLKAAVSRLQNRYPGLGYEVAGHSFHLLLPKAARQADSLGTIFGEFAGFVRAPATFPNSESSNLLAKYYVTTAAVAMANAKH